MGRRYGRGDIRHDFKLARARSVDAAWREAESEGVTPCELDMAPTEHEQRVTEDLAPLLQASLEQIEKETTGRNAAHALGGWLDPSCRFATHPSHRCHRNDGQPLGETGDCFAEARIQAVR